MKLTPIKLLAAVAIIFLASAFIKANKPALHTIGDSTVRNSNKETWGWGTLPIRYHKNPCRE
jgi:rhamnogalacturonan acetylesterase